MTCHTVGNCFWPNCESVCLCLCKLPLLSTVFGHRSQDICSDILDEQVLFLPAVLSDWIGTGTECYNIEILQKLHTFPFPKKNTRNIPPLPSATSRFANFARGKWSNHNSKNCSEIRAVTPFWIWLWNFQFETFIFFITLYNNAYQKQGNKGGVDLWNELMIPSTIWWML